MILQLKTRNIHIRTKNGKQYIALLVVPKERRSFMQHARLLILFLGSYKGKVQVEYSEVNGESYF
jgi:hypothetical protein